MDKISWEYKTVHIGKTEFEIPSHTTMAQMAEIWKGDSESFEALAETIVETNPRFAWAVVHAYLEKWGYNLLEKDQRIILLPKDEKQEES